MKLNENNLIIIYKKKLKVKLLDFFLIKNYFIS